MVGVVLGVALGGVPAGDTSLISWSPASPGDGEKGGDLRRAWRSGGEEEEEEERGEEMSSSKTSEERGRKAGPGAEERTERKAANHKRGGF